MQLLAAAGRAMASRGAASAATRGAATKAAVARSGPGRTALMQAAAKPARPMGEGPLPPPKPTQYNYSTRTGVLPAKGSGPQPVTQSRVQQARQALAQPQTRSQMMQAAAQQSRSGRTSRGGQGQRYWQGHGTEVVGGMPVGYDRMSIAGPRTMGMPSFGKSWQGEALSSRLQAGIGAAVDTQAAAQAQRERGSVVPPSTAVATMPPKQGPLQPPRYPGGLLPAPKASEMYQPQQTALPELRQPSGIKGGPLYRGGGDTPVSQGVHFMQPSGSSERGAQADRNGMFGSGVLWGEQTSNKIEGGKAWNANMPGSTLPGANDAENARIARARPAGVKPSKLYGLSLEWPKQGD